MGEQWHFWCVAIHRNAGMNTVSQNIYLRTKEKRVTKHDMKEIEKPFGGMAVLSISYMGYMTNDEFGWDL